MIGIDTNVLVRFLIQDHPDQSAAATAVISRLTHENPGFISTVVLAEVSWVLAVAYKTPRQNLATLIDGLLRSAELKVENAPAAYRALAHFKSTSIGDFADALIAEIANLAGAEETVTFDRAAARAFGMRLLG